MNPHQLVRIELSPEAKQFIADFELQLRQYPKLPKPIAKHTNVAMAKHDPLSPLTLALRKAHLI